MQVQVNSLWCLVHGIWDFCPWASGDKHCLATKCVCIANSIHYGIGSRDSVLTSGRPGSKHCSALKCMHGSDSNAHAVFQVQVNPVQLTLVIDSWFLVWIKSARQGCHVAHKSPSGIPGTTQCSVITTYAVGLCTWFNSGVDQVCTARPSCGVQIATRHPV